MSSQPPPPPWAWWYDNTRRPPSRNDLRVGDTERSQVADLLSKHYAEGRLDDDEFKERLERAMSAKTRSDLNGLTFDLPRIVDPAHPQPPVRRHPYRDVVACALASCVVLSLLAATVVTHVAWHMSWVLIAIVALLFWRRSSWGRWHHHHHSEPQGPPFG
jgi:Domain of unknown function (DUF1707)